MKSEPVCAWFLSGRHYRAFKVFGPPTVVRSAVRRPARLVVAHLGSSEVSRLTWSGVAAGIKGLQQNLWVKKRRDDAERFPQASGEKKQRRITASWKIGTHRGS